MITDSGILKAYYRGDLFLNLSFSVFNPYEVSQMTKRVLPTENIVQSQSIPGLDYPLLETAVDLWLMTAPHVSPSTSTSKAALQAS